MPTRFLGKLKNQFDHNGVTHSPLYNRLKCLLYVIMGTIVVLILKPQTLTRSSHFAIPYSNPGTGEKIQDV
jgi:predicted membrane channel-forming protein YqfA (hemolysin III family)